MKKIYLISVLYLLWFNTVFAKNISISDDFEFDLICKFQKTITRTDFKDLNNYNEEKIKAKSISNLSVTSKKPETLLIEGLSDFINTKSDNNKLEVKVVNKSVILFRAVNDENNYSESAVLDRKSGELIHEITKNINSENPDKEITFYLCQSKKQNI